MESPNITKEQLAIRTRLSHLLARHVRDDDFARSDVDFILAVLGRWLKDRAQQLVDPAD